MERSIYEFEKGDQITRLKPAKALWENMGGDRSYIGEKLIFLNDNQQQLSCSGLVHV